MTKNTTELMVHRDLCVASFVMYMGSHGIRKFRKRKSYTFELKLEVQFAESWCFKYMFVCEMGGSNRSQVLNTSRGSDSIVRLHWMHEMQTIVTDDCSVCLSVSRGSTRLHCANMKHCKQLLLETLIL